MNTSEMLAQLRLNCLLEDSAIDYPDSILLRELSDSLVAKYQSVVIGMRSGYWTQSYFQYLTAGIPQYRLSQQITVLSKVEIANASLSNVDDANFSRLHRIEEGHADLFEGSYSGQGVPTGYVLRGNDIVVVPTPDASAYVLKITFFRKPSRLYASQNAQGGFERGRVTAVNNTTKAITVNVLPFDMSITPTLTVVSGSRFDVVKPNGWFDQSLGDVVCTISGSVLTVTSPQPTRNVQVGDYVRLYGQTDWPMLPEDFHRSVVDTASVKILVQRGYQQKASNFAADVSSDLQRFEQLYSHRVREEPRIARAPLHSLRRGRLR